MSTTGIRDSSTALYKRTILSALTFSQGYNIFIIVEMCAAANDKYNHDECNHTFLVYKDSEHVKEGEEESGILGSPAEFCGAFYHTPEVPHTTLNMVCLDPSNCQIKGEPESQPKTAVALVKYEIDGNGGNVFLKRYTNCYEKQAHAEEHFKYDIMEGPLKQSRQISESASCEITMYITMQPCNFSTKHTQGTPDEYSCCTFLREIMEELPKHIKICIKPTHLYKAGWTRQTQEKKYAEDGLKGLMRNSRITFAAMTVDDWEYLWKQVNVPADLQLKVGKERNALDKKIGRKLAKWKEETEKEETKKQAANENKMVDEMNKMKINKK